MRVFVLPAITLSENKARYSRFLLASKLGRLAGRLQELHVYLLSPYPIKSGTEENPWFTVLELPPHTPFRNYPHPGHMVDPRAMLEAAVEYGPDVFIATQSSAAALYSYYVRSSQFARFAPTPFVLWDFSPESADTVKRSVGSAHPAFLQVCALEYVAADAVWMFGEAAKREPALEVILLDSERLDDLTRVLWEKAMAGNMQVIDCLLVIIRQRVALFGGPGEWLRLLLAGEAQEQPGPEDYAAMSDEALRRVLWGR